jgi:N-acetylglucosaminyl-diphospho-decaprenol L-rhamnosyltransferase
MVREEFPGVHLLQPAENLGYGRAVNLVASETDEPWIVAANADTRVRPGALARLLAVGSEFPRVGIVAPRRVHPDGATQDNAHRFPSVRGALAFNAGVIGAHPDAERAHDVPWALGAFLLIRRRAFEAVGGFDETLWMYAEDLDLGWRMSRAGWRTRYAPDAVVDHVEAASTTAAFGETRDRRRQAATYDWIARRRGAARARAIAAINYAGAAARSRVYRARAARTPDPWAGKAADWGRWAELHRDTGLHR